jgi:hypothetical protein
MTGEGIDELVDLLLRMVLFDKPFAMEKSSSDLAQKSSSASAQKSSSVSAQKSSSVSHRASCDCSCGI